VLDFGLEVIDVARRRLTEFNEKFIVCVEMYKPVDIEYGIRAITFDDDEPNPTLSVNLDWKDVPLFPYNEK
jgi:hypothetical protein